MVLLSMACCRPTREPSCESVSLRQRQTIPLPDSFDIRGASRRGSDALVFWSEQEVYVWNPSDSALRPMPTPAGRIVSAAYRDDRKLTYLVQRDSLLDRYDSSGADAKPTQSYVVHSLAHVEFDGNDWIVLEGLETGWRLSVLDLNGSSRGFATFRKEPGDTVVQALRFSMGADGDVFAYHKRWPFDGLRFTAAARDVAPFVSTTGLDPVLDDSVQAKEWLAVSLVKHPCGTLQTLADATSNRRLLVVRNRYGRATRVTSLDVPMGFIASDLTDSTFLAIRSLGLQEVVLYKWQD